MLFGKIPGAYAVACSINRRQIPGPAEFISLNMVKEVSCANR